MGPFDRLIGRSTELDALTAFAERIADGPWSLAVEGDAGVGKTALWLEGIAIARERGARVVSARPAEAEARLGLAGVGDLLDDVLDHVRPELPVPQADALAVALLLERPAGAAPEDRTVAVAVLNALRLLAAERPLIVAVDDVQWLDAASAAVLAFAWRRLRTEHVGLLVTRRSEAPAPAAPPADDPRTTRLDVGPLSLGAVHRMLEARLGLVLSRPALRRLHGVAGGNPFYALELGRALERHGSTITGGEPLPVPDRLHELVRDRIEALPVATRQALAPVAALSQPTLPVLGHAVEAGALGPAFDSRVLLLEGERVRFSHPLLASAVYSGLDPFFRRELHRRLSGLVAGEERARHLALAADGPDAAVAAALERASTDALARGATAAAAELCEQARTLTPSGDDDGWQRRTVSAARQHFAAGDTARAHELLGEALETAAAGPQRAKALTALSRVHLHGADQSAARDLAALALAEPGAGPTVRADAGELLASASFFLREDLPSALEHISQAAALATTVGEPHLVGNAVSMKAVIEVALGRPEWKDTLESLVHVGDAPRGEPVVTAPGFHGAMIALWTDRAAEAATLLRGYRESAIAHGDEGSLPLILAELAVAEFLTGRWADAATLAGESLDIAIQAEQRPPQAFALAARALVFAARGREAEARADAAAALDLTGDRGMVVARIHAVWALGILELSLNRPDAAASALTPLRRRLVAAGVREPGGIPFAADEVEALIGLDRIEEADAQLARLDEDAHAVGRASALAAARRCHGLLAAARGDVAAALDRHESALVQHERVGSPLDRARTLLALGTVQRRLKRRALARTTLERAQREFEALGAVIWSARAQAELARIGGRARAADGLTPTEGRVAALVAEGRSNKEIAAALFVTPKTVETQLSRIYGKLGVHSRVALMRTLGNL